jgi:hypothetical protein
MNLQVIKNRVLYWLKSIVVYTLYLMVLLVICSFFALQLPSVQTALTQRYLGFLSKVTGFESTIEEIEFRWFDRVSLYNVSIKDPEKNTMIFAREIFVNFEFDHLLEAGDVNLDAVDIDSAHVYLKQIQETDTSRNLNINIFIDKLNEQFKSSGSGGQAAKLTIGEALLERSRFTYHQSDRDSLTDRFDHNHFSLAVDDTQLQSFMVQGDTIEFQVLSLSAEDRQTRFKVHELNTFFRLSQRAMEFRGMFLRAGQSFISDTVVFHYSSQNDLNEFITRVNVEAHLDKTVIHPKDLAVFAPEVQRLTTPFELSGSVKGKVNRFKYRDMEIHFGSSHLLGSLDMDGLPDFNETFILLNLKNSRLRFEDLAFAFNEQTESKLKPLGTVSMNGQFLGYPTDFVAQGDFNTRMGRIISDINFKVNEKSFNESSYKGQLSMINFDLGSYLGDTTNFQQLSLSGRISGSGLTQNTANFILNGRIQTLGIRHYQYTNITTNARFASQFFNGELIIDDPNLELHALGFIDLRDNRNHFNIQARLDTANLHALKLSKDKLFLQSKLNLNFKGLDLDSLEGDAHIERLSVGYRDKTLAVKNIDVVASRNEHERSLELKTDLIDAKAAGDFSFSRLFRDVQVLTHEFMLGLKNDKAAIAQYYQNKNRAPDSYVANFDFNFKNITPITDLIRVDLDLSKNTVLDGKFTSGRTTMLQAFTNIDTLYYSGTRFLNTEVELNASKISDSTHTLAVAYINSEKQQLGSVLKTKNLITEAIWNKDHIDFSLNLDQENRDNYLRLEGNIDFHDSTRLHFADATKIKLLEKIWIFHPENVIAMKDRGLSFRYLNLATLEQSIGLNGRMSTRPEDKLYLNIKNFDLSLLNDLTQRALAGHVDSEVILANAYGDYTIQNTLSAHELKVDDFLIGDVTGNNTWSPTDRRFNLEFYIDRLGQRIVNCEGYYNPSTSDDPLHVTARFDKANLRIFEPFLDDIFSRFEGTLSGEYAITGKLSDPQLNGEGRVENGQLMVNYLKTVYQFTGQIGLTPTSVYFKNVVLQDLFKNTASLQGAITHANFKNMRINLDAQFENFQLLNTTVKDNSLFYGQGYASGNCNLRGPLNNLQITSTASTGKNTRIFIPIGGTSTAEKRDFINFVDFSDSTAQQSVEKALSKKIDISGITMELNIDVTPDAYCEIIFDAKAGDIIRGRGNGKIKLQLDTKGEFNMFGPIEFTEGGYNFTLYDIINKEFQIQSGSRITWFGDPYQGQMDIRATYNQLASLAPVLSKQIIGNELTTDQSAGTAQLRRKYPVQVLLKLDGPMLSPQINFDIIAKDLPQNIIVNNQPVQLAFEFQAFKSRLDEQELKRQVFSLIILRRFSPLESFNTSGSLVNSVSELFSNQLSYWMSQVDENLEIDVDLGTMDQEAFNTFQLRLSYTFLNGRLRITRDGTFGNQVNATNSNTSGRSDLSSVAGDWTLDYLLTPDGKFKVKMYSRTNVNPTLNTLGNQSTITTGVSLLHTQSFNELRDLLKSSRDKNRKKQTETPANEEAIKENDDNND